MRFIVQAFLDSKHSKQALSFAMQLLHKLRKMHTVVLTTTGIAMKVSELLKSMRIVIGCKSMVSSELAIDV